MKNLGPMTRPRDLVIVAIIGAAFAIQDAKAQTTPSSGWMVYHDTIGRSLNVTPEQQRQLQEWNARYEQEYERLGREGMEHSDYQRINDRRSIELQGLLTPEQFDRWNHIDQTRTWDNTHTTGGAPDPDTRREASPHPDPQMQPGQDREGMDPERNRALGTDRGTGTTGTGSATDGGNRNTVTPPTP